MHQEVVGWLRPKKGQEERQVATAPAAVVEAPHWAQNLHCFLLISQAHRLSYFVSNHGVSSDVDGGRRHFHCKNHQATSAEGVPRREQGVCALGCLCECEF